MSFLMWKYQGVDVGSFETAATAAKRTTMLGKGYFDATGQQSWAIPYPTGKGTTIKTPKPAPAPVDPTPIDPAPVDPIV